MITAISIIAATLIGVGIICAAVLALLAAGNDAPRRAPLRRPPSASESYIDRTASWAATARTDSAASPGSVLRVLTEQPYLNRLPFVTGPLPLAAGRRVTRTPLIGYEEEVVVRIPDREYATVGTGISIPLTIESFAQRFRIEPSGNGSRIEWTVAVTPKFIGWLPLRWTGFIARPVMRIVLAAALRGA
jgi:hypothetical protein